MLLSKKIKEALSESGFSRLTKVQEESIPLILKGENLLIIAPVASGKTEAAILPLLSKYKPSKGIVGLYITPLRALNRDMLRRISYWARKCGNSVMVRHGDTSKVERRMQAVSPPTLLITTPETLQIILVSKRMREHLKSVKWVVVDEVHEIVSSRRGVQLSLALERLRLICKDIQVIGLSATVGNPEDAARLIVGMRSVKIIKPKIERRLIYKIEYPFPTEEDHEIAKSIQTTPEAAARLTRIRELIEPQTSTLIFVNSRTHAELISARLSRLAKGIAVHHGSLSKEEREQVEESFRNGRLRGMVCTSTVELGIDVGSVDLVIQYMSPRQVSALIQRVGRSGHKLEKTPKGIVICAFPEDALEACIIANLAEENKVEVANIHKLSLDVLNHQLVGLCLDLGATTLNFALSLFKGSYAYKDLTLDRLKEVARYAETLGLIKKVDDYYVATKKGRRYYFDNASTIPDEKRYPLIDLTTGKMFATLGDEFVSLKAKVGMLIICKGMVWRIEKIGEDGSVYVTPSNEVIGALPGWDGELIPLTYEIANEVGRARRIIAEALMSKGKEHVMDLNIIKKAEHYARLKIANLIDKQIKAKAPVPCDNLILFESYENFLVIHACLGDSGIRCLAYLIEPIIASYRGIRNWWTDGYRILFELSSQLSREEILEIVERLRRIDNVERILEERFKEDFPFSYYLKFVAERFGAIKRGISIGYKGLDRLTYRFKSTPIFEETLREIWLEKLNVKVVLSLIQKIKEGRIKVKVLLSKKEPSPLSFSILNKFVEVPELISPELVKEDSVSRLKGIILSSTTNLLCFNCLNEIKDIKIKDLGDKVTCPKCNSSLLAIVNLNIIEYAKKLIKKRKHKERLSREELEFLSRLRRCADLVLSYGRKAIIAQMVYGIGPQTASRILARMHEDEEEFYLELLKAKINFILTRPFWDRE
jgi:ATP-dependent Lhr-like helicase